MYCFLSDLVFPSSGQGQNTMGGRTRARFQKGSNAGRSYPKAAGVEYGPPWERRMRE